MKGSDYEPSSDEDEIKFINSKISNFEKNHTEYSEELEYVR